MYRPNFCAECGERVERERWRWWTSEKFCGVCEKNAAKANRFWLAGFLLLFCCGAVGGISYQIGRVSAAVPLRVEQITSGAAGGERKEDEKKSFSNPRSDSAHSSAQANAPVYLCGARTKKGKPCSRRVSAEGERCWQHQGKRSMMRAVREKVKA